MDPTEPNSTVFSTQYCNEYFKAGVSAYINIPLLVPVAMDHSSL